MESKMGNKRRMTATLIAVLSMLISIWAFYLSNSRLLIIQTYHPGMSPDETINILRKTDTPENIIFEYKNLQPKELTAKAEKLISRKHIMYVANNSLNMFFLFSVWIFLFLYYLSNNILDRDPEYLKASYIRNVSKPDRAHLYIALAIVTWQVSSVIDFYLVEMLKSKATLQDILSTVNSAFFLTTTIYFDYDKPKPRFLKFPPINFFFQTGKGIAITTSVVISFIISWSLLGLDSTVPDVIYSFVVSVVLITGLLQIFRERLNNPFSYLVYLTISFTLFAQFALFPGLRSKIPWVYEKIAYLNFIATTTYKTLLIALFLVLMISWFTRIKEKIYQKYTDDLYESNNNLKDKIELIDRMNLTLQEINNEIEFANIELSEKNATLDRLNKDLSQALKENEESSANLKAKNVELDILKREVSHRINNYFTIINTGIDNQIKKYPNGDNNTVLELKLVKARFQAILSIQEILDRPTSSAKSIDKLPLNDYFNNLLDHIKEAFDYKNTHFIKDLNLPKDLSCPIPILKELGMIVTELALNVEQHAYQPNQIKKIKISALIKREDLHIEVEDYGKGFGEEEFKYNNHSNGQLEMGHGLSIIKAIISQFKGILEIHAYPDHGTRVVIIFKKDFII